MLGSKNDFFREQKKDKNEQGRLKRLAYKREVVKRLLQRKKFDSVEKKQFLEAYDFFVKNKLLFDGATVVKDVYDIPKLELSAMLHDYQYIVLLSNYKGVQWLKVKYKYDKEYCENLVRFGKLKSNNVAMFRFMLLLVSTPFYIVFKWILKLV